MIILNDYLHNIVKKGEVVAEYYNPGNFFHEVHIVMIHEHQIIKDSKEFSEVKKMVGSAELYLYNLPKPGFLRSLAWSSFLMKNWYFSGISLANKIGPDVIRTYNNYLDGYLAYQIKVATGIPYIVSLHDSTRFMPLNIKKMGIKGYLQEKMFRYFIRSISERALSDANAVIAVYQSIFKYASQYAESKVRLLYNKVAVKHISRKKTYVLHEVPQIITVNRQILGKNPENILRAIKDIPCHYTMIGDGELHDDLINLARELNCIDKVTFIKSMPNDKLCEKLSMYDVVIVHSDYLEISKGTIEAAFAGLPIIINRNSVSSVEDLLGNWVMLCENSVEGYHNAIQKILLSEELRMEYGKNALFHAHENFDAEKIEKETIEIYKTTVLSRNDRR